MPEGPELHLSSQFINAVCKGRIFKGKVRKNPIHKCADVVWDATAYTITACSRGKELKVFLQTLKSENDEKPVIKNGAAVEAKNAYPDRLHILFNFGMSGKFEFTSAAALPKHAHLSFFTQADPQMALSFVDYRRFGKWQTGADWTADRGPCVLFEYAQFRSNVLNSLSDSAFNKPVCEVLLNQKYFNGIGNYLRAEICYRAGVRPFDQALAVFASLPDVPEDMKIKTGDDAKTNVKVKVKTEGQDILELCNTIALEVVGLETSLYLPEDEHSEMSKFSQWLQCYYKPGMKNICDHNKRTMWFHGDPGPMVPREGGSKKRHATYDKKLAQSGKKMKKEAVEKSTQQLSEDTSISKKGRQAVKKGKQSSSRKQAEVSSPAKPKRVTRTSLKTLPEQSKTSRKPSKVKSDKSNAAGSEDSCRSRAKKPAFSRKRSEGKTGSVPTEADVGSKVKRRATRSLMKKGRQGD